MLMLWEKSHPGLPWLTKDAIALMETFLTATSVGIEWGSGRSTVWFAARVGVLYSIEYNAHWAAKVQGDLASRGLTGKVVYSLCPDGAQDAPDTEYVKAVASVPDGRADFCLVDGGPREWCAWASIDKIRPGGLLVIDNANWFLPTPAWSPTPGSVRRLEDIPSQGWRDFWNHASAWQSRWTSNGVSDTLILQKPGLAGEHASDLPSRELRRM